MTSSAATVRQKAYAPGARVEIRDEEWLVRSVRPATFGGQAVHVVGMSELVRNKDAIFLTELDSVRELLPRLCPLVLRWILRTVIPLFRSQMWGVVWSWWHRPMVWP